MTPTNKALEAVAIMKTDFCIGVKKRSISDEGIYELLDVIEAALTGKEPPDPRVKELEEKLLFPKIVKEILEQPPVKDKNCIDECSGCDECPIYHVDLAEPIEGLEEALERHDDQMHEHGFTYVPELILEAARRYLKQTKGSQS